MAKLVDALALGASGETHESSSLSRGTLYMNNKQAKIFAASLGAEMPELDLHGLYPREALDKLELFLFANRNKQMLRVIYGGGTGKLMREVVDYLKKHPLVDEVIDNGGSCVVVL